MAKQWVDITTIDNNTPFMRVRWKANLKSGDKWFAESPGLVTDGMGWTQGTKDSGWFSAHRMNNWQYCCSFNFDHTQGGFWDVSGTVYRDHVKNTGFSTSGFYDSTVQINGTTYYEIDFSLWSGASGYNLYMPYSNPLNRWNAGDVYVEVGEDFSLDKDIMVFRNTGGTNTVTVDAPDSWTAVVSDSWITASTLSGESGQTSVTISTPDYQGLTDRTGTVVFTSNGESLTLTVKQRKVSSGGVENIYLGDTELEALYIGNTEIEACYLGDLQIF